MNKAESQDNTNNAARDIDDILIKYSVEIIRKVIIVDGVEVETFHTQDRYIEDDDVKEADAKITNLPF